MLDNGSGRRWGCWIIQKYSFYSGQKTFLPLQQLAGKTPIIHTHPQSETDDSHEKIDDIGNDHADDDDLKIKPPVSLKLKLIQVGKTVQS